MMDEDAPCVLEGAPTGAEEMTDLIPRACILRDMLEELIAGTREAPGIRSILKFATPHLTASKSECFSSKNPVGSTFTKGLKRLAVEGGTACGHICPQHPVELDAAVWSCLPGELLELIFAKLPVPEIYRLRCLSRQWKRDMIEKSRFRGVCAETNPKMFALISEDTDARGLFWVKLYDINTNKWHVFKLFVGSFEEPFQTMSATDGGLVCFISTWKATEKYPLQIVVCNPLTQDMRTFVLEGVSTEQVEMMQIVADRNTGHYKMIVLVRHIVPSLDALNCVHLGAELYDSQTEKWTSLRLPAEDQLLHRDLFFGIRYNWRSWLDRSDLCDVPENDCIGPCAWDNVELKINELNDDSNPLRVSVEDYALVGDRLFVLHDENLGCFVGDPNDYDDQSSVDDQDSADDDSDAADYLEDHYCMMDQYCISEYRGQIRHPNWVKLRTISCSPLELRPTRTDYRMRLHACEGFLMIVAYNDEWHTPYDHEIGWLYDLSTNEWRALPYPPGGIKLQDVHDSLLCELRWDTDLNPLNLDVERSFVPVGALSDEF